MSLLIFAVIYVVIGLLLVGVLLAGHESLWFVGQLVLFWLLWLPYGIVYVVNNIIVFLGSKRWSRYNRAGTVQPIGRRAFSTYSRWNPKTGKLPYFYIAVMCIISRPSKLKSILQLEAQYTNQQIDKIRQLKSTFN